MKFNDRFSAFLNGAGFYIVLLLAIAIIGVSGYFIYAAIMNNRPAETPAGQEVPLTQQPEHDPAAETEPPSQEDTETPAAPSVSVSATAPVEAEEEARDTRVLAPLSGETVTPFSMEELLFSETMGDWRTHDGIDIAAAEGAQVTAAAAGEVTSVVDDYWMGTTVTVDCGDGCELRYASLQSPAAVSAGDTVSPGDVIGAVGSTALLEEAVGPHLHFTVLQSGVAVDPAAYLARNGAA